MQTSSFTSRHTCLLLGLLCFLTAGGLFLNCVPRSNAAAMAAGSPLTQIKKLTASDGVSDDGFYQVGISGNTVVVGAYGNNNATGAAYIFDRGQGGTDNWGLVKKITPTGALGDYDYFGAAVGISGDTIVIGAYQDDTHKGAAYIFKRNQGGANNWGQVKKFTASDVSDPDFFGSAVAISGDTVVIGAYHKQFFSGAAYIFGRNQGGTENWGQVKKLASGDLALSDQFGASVAISGDTVAIGAYGKNSNIGAAYLFSRNQGGANAWGQIKKLSLSDGIAQDAFGGTVAISGDTVVVGAFGRNSTTGAAYVYERNQGGAGNWGQVRALTANDGIAPDRFGVSIGISGDLVVVGADQNYGNAGQTFGGAAYLFGRNQGGIGNWGQAQKLTANDEAEYDYFGASAGIDGDANNGYQVIIGALFANDHAGAAYIFSDACAAPLLTPATLADAQVGAPYSQTVTASTPGVSYSYVITSGSLPNGLVLNPSTGLISGTPAQLGQFNFSIAANSANGCPGYGNYTINVATCAPITLNPATLANGTVGAAYNQTVSASPSLAYGFSITSGALPNGLTLNAATGVISGTPAAAGVFAFRVAAASGGCSSYRDYNVAINCATVTLSPTLPNATAGVNYSQTVTAAPADAYSFSLAAGSLPNGLMLNAETGAISGLPFATGAFNFTIKAQSAGGCIGQQSYAVTVNCPTITLSTLSTPALNVAYNQTATAAPAGGAYNYAITAGALPAGLSFNSATGVVSGTPTLAGTFNFTITATGWGSCSGGRAYSFVITNACPAITLPALPGGNVDQMYNSAVAASPAGNYTYTLTGTLPPGVTFYNSAGLLFGFPAVAGTYNFSITATDANNCTASKSYSVKISN